MSAGNYSTEISHREFRKISVRAERLFSPVFLFCEGLTRIFKGTTVLDSPLGQKHGILRTYGARMMPFFALAFILSWLFWVPSEVNF
jgi:hypothetical protein